jgi:hypothetical protein
MAQDSQKVGIFGALIYAAVMQKPPNRRPNTICDNPLCNKPIYRRPSVLERNENKYCSRSCHNKAKPPSKGCKREPKYGSKNPAWKGGRYTEPVKGYVLILLPEHPRARKNGYVLEHILVAEAMLGRSLTDEEEVHHIDRNRANNDPSNLKVYASHLAHWMTEHYEDVARARDAAKCAASSKDMVQP